LWYGVAEWLTTMFVQQAGLGGCRMMMMIPLYCEGRFMVDEDYHRVDAKAK
jgi:hypothetical protein